MEDKILKSVFILAGSLVLSKILPRLITVPREKQTSKARTVIGFLRQVVVVVIYFLAALAVLGNFEVDITPFLLSSTVIGFTIGFGAQNIIKDLISGIYLILEPDFKIGRQLEIGTYSGILKKVTLKNTYLEDERKGLFIIPNGEIKTFLIKKEAPKS